MRSYTIKQISAFDKAAERRERDQWVENTIAARMAALATDTGFEKFLKTYLT